MVILSRRARLLGLLALAGARLAAAQEFQDDVESGTLLASDPQPGAWQWDSVDRPGVSITASMAAAHRGRFGISQVDANQGSGSGVSNDLSVGFAASTAPLYARLWLRMAAMNTPGFVMAWQLHGNSTVGTVTEFTIYDDLSIEARAWDKTSSLVSTAGPPVLEIGRWHLVEVETLGVGTAAGALRIFVDGSPYAMVTGVDWSGIYVTHMNLGEPWASLAWTGELQFDDVRLSTTRPAERIRVSTDASIPLEVGGCLPVEVSLADVEGAPAPAPYEVVPALEAAPPGSFHADAACTQEPGALTIARGASSTVVYFRPAQEGATLIRASHPDFLSAAELALDVQPAVSPPLPLTSVLKVGCGCESAQASASQGVLGWAVFELLRRSRRGGLRKGAAG